MDARRDMIQLRRGKEPRQKHDGTRELHMDGILEKVWLHWTFASLYFFDSQFYEVQYGQLLFKLQLARDQNHQNFTITIFF